MGDFTADYLYIEDSQYQTGTQTLEQISPNLARRQVFLIGESWPSGHAQTGASRRPFIGGACGQGGPARGDLLCRLGGLGARLSWPLPTATQGQAMPLPQPLLLLPPTGSLSPRGVGTPAFLLVLPPPPRIGAAGVGVLLSDVLS